MYITYDEYTAKGGKLDLAAFNIYAYEANQKIKEATFNRITTPSEAVKRCMVRLTDLLADYDNPEKNVSSFSNDGLSQSYYVSNGTERAAKIRLLIKTYLINEKDANGVPLMYCGVVI